MTEKKSPFKKIMGLFQPKAWEDKENYSPFKRFFFKWIGIVLASVQGFLKNNGFDRPQL